MSPLILDLAVRLVTPAIIAGADNSTYDDPLTLRPPSVRGQLRFWTDALTAGSDHQALWRRHLWGDTEIGQRIRILGTASLVDDDGKAAIPRPTYLFPHKSGDHRAAFPVAPPGSRSLLRFRLPEKELLRPLQAVVWTWLNLGTIGRRGRRGYGSLLWEPNPGHLLDGFLDEPLHPGRHLAKRSDAVEYLRTGLAAAWDALSVAPESSRQSADEFELRSLEQVFVGRPISNHSWHAVRGTSEAGPDDTDGSYEYLLHGKKPAKRGGPSEQKQLGTGIPRQPSPMSWRLLPCTSGGDFVVLTWSPLGYSGYPTIDRDSGLGEMLADDFGVENPLEGTSIFG